MGVEGKGNPDGVVGNWKQDAERAKKRKAAIAKLEAEGGGAAIANPTIEETEGGIQALTNALRPKGEMPASATPKISSLLEGPSFTVSVEDPGPEEDGEK